MKEIIPKEDKEAEGLAYWLRLNWYIFTHIWNESWQRWTINIIKMMAKKKRLWVSKGVPDFLCILKRWSLLFIELKRAKKSLSKVSKEQQSWIDELNKLTNIEAHICYWCKEAIKLIESLESK